MGLFQVFELGLLEINAHVIDSLPEPGDQCIELYPDKPIYDIPAVPICTGRELTDNLLKQIEPFHPQFHLGQEVTHLDCQSDDRFLIRTSQDQRFITKTLFIAAGVGALQPRTLNLEGLDAYVDQNVFYRVKQPDQFIGKRIVICGGGDSVIDWVLYFADKAASVTLIHRRDDFKAALQSIAKMRELCASGKINLFIGQITGYDIQNDQLSEITLTDNDGNTKQLALDDLLIFWSIPKTRPDRRMGSGY